MSLFQRTRGLIATWASALGQLPPEIMEGLGKEEGDLHRPDPIAATLREMGEPHTVKHPRGKGIFVQTVHRATRGGTPGHLADLAEEMGLGWVMLLCIWQHPDRDRLYGQTLEASHALRERGIEPWVWGWPETSPGRIERFVQHMGDSFENCDAEGVVLNVEAPFYGRSRGAPRHAAAARELMSAMRVRVKDAPIGLSSYGARFWHESAFPWDAFSESCDFGMPQIYDAGHRHGPGYPERCFVSWQKGFDIVCPTLAASKRFTPSQMRAKINQTPLSPALSWWDMNHLRYSKGRQAVVAECEVDDGH